VAIDEIEKRRFITGAQQCQDFVFIWAAVTFAALIKTYRHRTYSSSRTRTVKNLLRKPVVAILGILIVAMLWLAFRPELLFVNKSVDDPFPTTTATAPAKHL